MAEGMGLPEGSTEAPRLRKDLKEAKSNLSRIADGVGTLVVIVVAGVILKLLDFTSAKETEFNDKAHSFAASAIASQLQFAQAANEQKVAALTLARAILNGQDANIVGRAQASYENAYSSYQLKNYDLIRLSDNGDIRHFLSGEGDLGDFFKSKVGLHSAAPDEMANLQGYVTGTLGPVARHYDCLSELADRYQKDPEHAKAALTGASPTGADGKPVGIVCKDAKDGRLYGLSDELERLDACETELERRIYGLADKLMIDGWLKVGAEVNQSPSKLPKGYLWTSTKPCTAKALSGTALTGVTATIDRLPGGGVPATPPPVPAPADPITAILTPSPSGR
jgi:hypothetical protein